MLQNTFYTLFVVRINFIVSSQFRYGMRIARSPLKDEMFHSE